MTERKTTAMYFSPVGTTEKVVTGIARRVAENIGGAGGINIVDFTLPAGRREPVAFSAQDVVIFGVPVYAGRVPNLLLKYLSTITGNGATAVAVVVFGHRDYEDALVELTDILHTNGFKVIGGGAFIGAHCLSKTLAKDRPDQQDMNIATDFANSLAAKLAAPLQQTPVAVKGQRPYRKHYAPPKTDGQPIDIRKVTPKTNDNCINCQLCAHSCPMGAIDHDDVTNITGICIKCGACINKCPTQAKYYDDQDFLIHIREVEDENMNPRKEPEVFL